MNVFLGGAALLLADHRYRHTAEGGNTADDSSIITEITVTMELHKIIKQRMNVIQCHRTGCASGKLHRIPGIFSTLFLFFQIVFHRLCRFCLHILWIHSHFLFLVHPQNVCQHIPLVFTVYDLIHKTVLQ